ncbi:MAG: PAS domain S-box protein [Lacunisphaera sp.]
MITSTGTDGYICGEFYYAQLFDSIDRRLNLARRYQTTVCVEPSLPLPGAAGCTEVYATAVGQDVLDPRLKCSLDQHLTITLTPRPDAIGASRQYLPELALYSGLGVSVLLGLVTNLAQAALRRQRSAEETSRQLRGENEERRRVEGRLKTADERLNLAFESTQAGVYEWDVETDHVYCTPSIWKMIGADPSEMPGTGAGWLALLHPDDRPAVRAVIDAHFRGETPLIEIEHCVHLRSGEWMWLALRAKCTSFAAGRRPRRVLGTVLNINARKRADEALRASQAESRKLSLVASKTDNAVVITDPAGHIDWANESYSRLTGRRLAEVARRPLLDFLASPDADPGAGRPHRRRAPRLRVHFHRGHPAFRGRAALPRPPRRAGDHQRGRPHRELHRHRDGHHRPRRNRAAVAARQGGGRRGVTRQVGIPRVNVARDPHADERRDRHDQPAARHRPHARAA